jgi:hypothetical protein
MACPNPDREFKLDCTALHSVPVRCAECIVYEYIGILRELAGKVDIVLLFFLVEATVLQQHHVTVTHLSSCYVMLCYVMLCYVMLCYVMLCYVMLR